MKILVTGGTGFLGQHLCRRLVEDGHRVRVLRRATSNIKGLTNLGLEFEVGDITDPDSVKSAVKGQDAVIHAAAHTAFYNVNRIAEDQINVQGTRNVGEACKQGGIRLLHVSSVAAVGISPDSEQPANEDFDFNLEGSGMTYHLSKRRAEAEVMKQSRQGLEAVVVNPALCWGPEKDSYRGADALRKPLTSWLLPYGPGGRCLVHVSDVVNGILLALQRGRNGERYILGGDNVTFREINEAVCDRLALHRLLLPIPGAVAELGNKAKSQLRKLRGKPPLPIYDRRFCYQFYDSTKARSELGFAPRAFSAIVKECAIKSGWLRGRSNGSMASVPSRL
jgi:dihydroflavonol-4-reductase